jgi:tetratricopeptide (TPR) repeat protein
VILIAWAVPRALEQRAPAGRWLAVSLVVLLTGAWMANTFAYLSEWEEPRSVWYAAVRKSDDPNLYLYLGSHYQDMAGILSKPAVLTGDQKTELTRLAEAEWRGDERLPALLREWAAQSYAGPQSLAFGAHLRSVAWTQYETCLRVKGGRVLHNLFFRRGMILVDSKNWLAARAEFQQAYEESRLLAFAPARDDMAIRCHFALGIVAANLGERDEALRMFVLADEEQRRFGQVVEPRIETALQQLRKNRP